MKPEQLFIENSKEAIHREFQSYLISVGESHYKDFKTLIYGLLKELNFPELLPSEDSLKAKS